MSYHHREQKSSIHRVEFPKDFFGIEDAGESAEEIEAIDGGEVKPGDIDGPIGPAKDQVIDGGTIIMRTRVATTVLSLWAVWTLAGLIAFATTGNAMLLMSTPAIMSIPLYKVMGYYF